MIRLGQEHVLLIGDVGREMETAIAQAAPSARITLAPTYFDGIAELAGGHFTAILACAEPIERRPDAAIQTLRQFARDSRLVLFGHPTLEPLSRKMMQVGCDDYVVTPPSPEELQQIFGKPLVRTASTGPAGPVAQPIAVPGNGAPAPAASAASSADPVVSIDQLPGVELADIVLEALNQHPGDAANECLRQINALIEPAAQLIHTDKAQPAPIASANTAVVSHVLRAAGEEPAGELHLLLHANQNHDQARHALSQLASLLGKVISLQERQNRLQKLAITDQLTGVYNRRWFEHFLSRILEKARTMRFAVTLLLIDIDNFKGYNDQYGHGLGDEILRETATLMRRCCREHDLVARIGGDEFAVVFWDKEGPRQPKDPSQSPPSRPQQTPRQIFDRFRRLLATREFPALGKSGRGQLSISGGFASYPWDGRDVNELVEAADKDLMFGAKKARKNAIFLVGNHDQPLDSLESSPPPK